MSDYNKCIVCKFKPFCKPSDICWDTKTRMKERDEKVRSDTISEFANMLKAFIDDNCIDLFAEQLKNS